VSSSAECACLKAISSREFDGEWEALLDLRAEVYFGLDTVGGKHLEGPRLPGNLLKNSVQFAGFYDPHWVFAQRCHSFTKDSSKKAWVKIQKGNRAQSECELKSLSGVIRQFAFTCWPVFALRVRTASGRCSCVKSLAALLPAVETVDEARIISARLFRVPA